MSSRSIWEHASPDIGKKYNHCNNKTKTPNIWERRSGPTETTGRNSALLNMHQQRLSERLSPSCIINFCMGLQILEELHGTPENGPCIALNKSRSTPFSKTQLPPNGNQKNEVSLKPSAPTIIKFQQSFGWRWGSPTKTLTRHQRVARPTS